MRCFAQKRVRRLANFPCEMKKLLLFWMCFFAVLSMSACGSGARTESVGKKQETKPALPVKYAKNFSVDSVGAFRVLTVRGGTSKTFRWVLMDSAAMRIGIIPEGLRVLPKLRLPLKRIAILSTTYLGYMEALGITDNVVATGNRKYIADSLRIPVVGDGAELSAELLFASKPDAVFAFSTGTDAYDAYPKLAPLRLSVVFTTEWLEASPLAKAEWIKFFGVLSGCEGRADSLFDVMERDYLQVRARVNGSAAARPVVFTGTPGSGMWFASGGRSYMASLIRDAGGKYLWDSDTSAGTYTLPLDRAFADARDADVWMNPGGWHSRGEGLAVERRIALFRAWKQGEVLQYDARRGPEGGLDFYEGAIVRPADLLRDVARWLHPELFKDWSPVWYRKLSIL